jgi:hypothetical protein
MFVQLCVFLYLHTSAKINPIHFLSSLLCFASRNLGCLSKCSFPPLLRKLTPMRFYTLYDACGPYLKPFEEMMSWCLKVFWLGLQWSMSGLGD